MLIWRVTNNIDAKRDIFIDKENQIIGIDATTKNKEFDNFTREWPKDVNCSKDVLDKLIEKKVIDIDDDFIKKYYVTIQH